MRQLRPRLPVVGVLARAGLIPALLLATTGMHMVMFGPIVHIAVVGAAGSLAMTASVAMSVIAARRNDGRAVWIGMAFSVIATLLVIHGLATPGIILPANGLVQVAGALNLPVCGAILAASGLPLLRRPPRVKLLLAVQFAMVVALGTAGGLALVFARDIPVVPNPTTFTANAIFVAGAIPLVLLAWRAARTYLLTRRLSDLIVTEGVVWLIGAQYGLLNFTMADGAWWTAHLLEFAGIGMVGIPAALDLRHAVGSRPLVGDLRASELVENEETFLGGRVRALLVRLGEKDPSTEGHTRLPNAILKKLGRLTDTEFAEIRRHPAAGRELLNELGGFSPLVLELVESHHERLDGHGYPNRFPAGELDLAVRILTVADVYDALTADRVYREAWSADRALALLEDEAGSAFDPVCVAALRKLVALKAPAPNPVVPLVEYDKTPVRDLPSPAFGEAAA